MKYLHEKYNIQLEDWNVPDNCKIEVNLLT